MPRRLSFDAHGYRRMHTVSYMCRLGLLLPRIISPIWIVDKCSLSSSPKSFVNYYKTHLITEGFFTQMVFILSRFLCGHFILYN